ncbi:MAG: RHS repeat-associated core domain-containing protein, partial [Holophagales bacterium]|nr:RHS repeat-associated core domain-containing protein [Holophagales bacterium]
ATPTSAADPVHKFTGHERDPGFHSETPLDYMHARYCSPVLGRFLSVDPVVQAARSAVLPQLWNRYTYSLNNPLNVLDPTGRVIKFTNSNADDVQKLLTQLSGKTGLTLEVRDGLLVITGKVTDAEGRQAGSDRARDALSDAVNSDRTLWVRDLRGSNGTFLGNIIGRSIISLDFEDIEGINTGDNAAATFDSSMIFLHELGHWNGLEDPRRQILDRIPHMKGDTVNFVNDIRSELNLPHRNQYRSEVDRSGRNYLPFADGPILIPGKIEN